MTRVPHLARFAAGAIRFTVLVALALPPAQQVAGQEREPTATLAPTLIAELPGVTARQVVATADGQRLYHDDAFREGLWLHDVPSGHSTRILGMPVAGFALAPQGNRLAFVLGERGGAEGLIWRLALDSVTGLPAGPAQPVSRSLSTKPSFSADGVWIAFSASEGAAGGRLVVVPAQGGAERVLATGMKVAQPRWPADGAWLYFAASAGPSSAENGSALLRVPFFGGVVEEVALVREDHPGQRLIFTPDAMTLIRVGPRQDGACCALRLTSVHGGAGRGTADLPAHDGVPTLALSADGRTLIYASAQAGLTRVYSVDVSGVAPLTGRWAAGG